MLIAGATVCDAKGSKVADIRIENSKIISVSKGLKPKKGETVLSCHGMFVVPGIIDIGSRLSQGGSLFSQLESLAKKAVCGGVTTVALQPSRPVNDEIDTDYYISKSSQLALCDILPVASATKDNDAKILNNLSILFKSGAVGAAIDSDCDANILRRVFEYSQMSGKPIFVRCKNDALDGDGVMNDSELAFKLGLGGIGSLGEQSELARLAQFASQYGCNCVATSLSVEGSVDLLQKSSPPFGWVDAHHLVLDESACDGFNSYAKNSPPLRACSDAEALKNAILRGQIKGISSGHTEVSHLAKDVAFEDASWGIESLSILWPLLYTKLVKSGLMKLEKLCELTSLAAAQILGLQAGLIRAEQDASLIIFDPNASFEVDVSDKSPYHGLTLAGSVSAVLVKGCLVYKKDGAI